MLRKQARQSIVLESEKEAATLKSQINCTATPFRFTKSYDIKNNYMRANKLSISTTNLRSAFFES